MDRPGLQGIFTVKLPVSDLATSRAWYERVFGYDVELEFPGDDGVVRGVAGHLPGVPDSFFALREAPEVARAIAGVNLLNLGVADRDALSSWVEQLDALGIEHSPVIDATVGWMIVFHDPDGIELHLYTRERHAQDLSERSGYGRTTDREAG